MVKKTKKSWNFTWPQRILFGIAIFIFFFLFSKLAVTLFLKWHDKKKNNENDKDTAKNLVIEFLKKVIGISIIIIGIYVSLSFIGMDMSTILVFLGSAGLGVALALKDFIASCVNGIIIITLNYYKVGDLIKYGELLGNVSSFNLVNTIIKDVDGVSYIIPNSKIVNDGYVTYSRDEKISLWVEACISSADPSVNIQKILDGLKEELKNKDYNNSDQSFVFISEMNEFGTVIGGGFEVNAENYFMARKLLRFRVREYLRKQGVLLCNSGSRYVDSVYHKIVQEE